MMQSCNECSVPQESFLKRVAHTGAIAIIIFILYFFAQEFKLVPAFTPSEHFSLFTIFILGLVASSSTCMATTGAMFLATIGKLQPNKVSMKDNIIPAVSFNAGRIATYGIFGYLTGWVGQVISTDLHLGSYLSLFVAFMMILIGLDMLKIVPLSSFVFTSFAKKWHDRIQAKLLKFPKRTSFILGVISYILPCGFTHTVQMYALGLANPMESAIVMMVFAIGTTPALLAIAFASSFSKFSFYPTLFRVMGVLIFMIGVGYFSNFLTLYGVNPLTRFGLVDAYAQLTEEGYQKIEMSVSNEGYSPNSFTVKKGVPVKWVINGENVFGCQGFLVSPKLGIQKTLEAGENIITFMPEEKGTVPFSCSMGMFQGMFNVI